MNVSFCHFGMDTKKRLCAEAKSRFSHKRVFSSEKQPAKGKSML